MISCTDFIGAYSELFTYLDEHYGHEEVERFWTYLFEPTGKGIPLINFAKEKGLRGCWEYWGGTLSEEAADVTSYMNEKEGWITSTMHYCPSKGRLLELQKEVGLVPYYDYCSHCNYYRSALDKVGLKWIRNHVHVDKAQCSSILYDPNVFTGTMDMSADVEVNEIRSKDMEYFHRDFHSSLNMGIDYMAKEHGEEALIDYLKMYTKHVYNKAFENIQGDPLDAIAAHIQGTYLREKAQDVLHIQNDGKTLSVRIDYCPAVKHLRETGRDVSAWFQYATTVVMQEIASFAGVHFEMDDYNAETGAAAYHFCK